MKVVLISSFFDLETGGGTAILLRELAHGLQSFGYQVVVVTTHRKKQSTVDYENGLTVYRIFPRNLYWIGDKHSQTIIKKIVWHLVDIWNVHAFYQVRKILNKENPDIVHFHKLEGMSPSIWSAASQAGIKKLVHTSHDYELFAPEGTRQNKINEWVKNRSWPVRLFQTLRTSSSRNINCFTAPSQYVLDIHKKRGIFINSISKVVPNSHGITNKEIKRRMGQIKNKIKSDKDKIRFLYVGRFDRLKGVNLLCKAFQICSKENSNIMLDLIGEGNLYLDLRKQYAGNPQINFHGYKSGAEKEKFFSDCDVVVVPSVWQEPFGIVIVESFSFGKPVIATKVGGIPEIIEDGVTGFLIPLGDIKALTDVISRVSDSSDKINQMAEACFEASKFYTIETMLANYDSIYRTL